MREQAAHTFYMRGWRFIVGVTTENTSNLPQRHNFGPRRRRFRIREDWMGRISQLLWIQHSHLNCRANLPMTLAFRLWVNQSAAPFHKCAQHTAGARQPLPKSRWANRQDGSPFCAVEVKHNRKNKSQAMGPIEA